MLLPVIMAGGAGTRLWPLSRTSRPKQFLNITSDNSLLQQTVERLSPLDHQGVLLVCNEQHRFIAAEQLRQVSAQHQGILLEPDAKNTAATLALSAFYALEQDADAILLALPADHAIADQDAFIDAVELAITQAKQDKIVTFGIVPTRPETGYGYVQISQPQPDDESCTVQNFVEKPERNKAKEFCERGDYFWNSGIFVVRARRYLTELRRYQKEIHDSCKSAFAQRKTDMDFTRIDRQIFSTCPNNSIDKAIMEPVSQRRDQSIVLVPLSSTWSDIGCFNGVAQVCANDAAGNVFKGDVEALETRNSMVISEDKLVATLGVEDLIVINTKDCVLVTSKKQSQKVKLLVDKLQIKGRSEVDVHREVHRPWGKYDLVDRAEHFQVKRLTVAPGAKISLQMHHYRAEHWIVVSGTAKVTLEQTESFLTENESIYIPIAAVHCLENPGEIDLEIIEVQSGSYLGEDDIVRFDQGVSGREY